MFVIETDDSSESYLTADHWIGRYSAEYRTTQELGQAARFTLDQADRILEAMPAWTARAVASKPSL